MTKKCIKLLMSFGIILVVHLRIPSISISINSKYGNFYGRDIKRIHTVGVEKDINTVPEHIKK